MSAYHKVIVTLTIVLSVIPAYRALADHLEHQEALATDEDGVWEFSNGEDYYAYALPPGENLPALFRRVAEDSGSLYGDEVVAEYETIIETSASWSKLCTTTLTPNWLHRLNKQIEN